MKTHFLTSEKIRYPQNRDGFSLVVVLTMLVLLMVLAIGLLTLSSVALRTSGHGQALAEARANARLALMLALGDLQKFAGPDQRITSRADILDEDIANPRLTGVWNSWEISATEPPSAGDYEAKDGKFRGWLVSSPDPEAAARARFADTPPSTPVTLLGAGSLGKDAPAIDHVVASRVPLGSSPGALAWAVMDEGVKARLNTPYSNQANSVGSRTAQLGSGTRPAAEFISGLDLFKRSQFESGSVEFAALQKGITRSNFAMAGESFAPGVREILQPLAHDFTIHSLGLFTDTARGGLKQDFHLLTDAAKLPQPYDGQGVYGSLLGLRSALAPSDPRWDSLKQFATIHRDGILDVGGAPTLRTRWPANWQAAILSTSPRKVTISRRLPTGVVLMPTVAKVQMLFSLVGRDIYGYDGVAGTRIPPGSPQIHGPQGDYFRGTEYEYDLHLLYTPIVTLHNPYNVALEFNKMRVEFANVPFAATVYRNGIAQNRGLAPFERMWADNENGQTSKLFGMNLKTKTSGGTPGSVTFRLLPGETKMFSPYIDPNRTWRQDLADRKFWDIYLGDGKTNQIDAIPGWRGDGIGFDLDWWNPANVRIPGPDKEFGRWAGCLGLSRNDKIHVEFAPLSEPAVSSNKFSVLMTAALTASGNQMTTSAIEIDYQSPDGLQRFLLGRGNTLRYPKEGTVSGLDLLDHSSTPIKNLARVKPFALLTVQAKTTSGGRDADAGDGRYGTKPWAFAHASIGASTQKILTEHPANHSHEIDLQRLDNGTANVLQIDGMDRANYITGHTAFNGSKFGALYEIPLHPIQSLSTLNGANPGGGSSYLPRFAQPIGNSWAHPSMSSNRLLETRPDGNLLDHSFLLNLALYDRFYFSGLAAQTGPFGTKKSTAALAGEFLSGEPLDDPRLILHRPGGQSSEDFNEVTTAADGYARIAGWQLMQGPFNINSTSVSAWKAMLGSIHDAQAIYNQLDPARGTTKITPLPETDFDEARVSRFRLPAMISSPRDLEAPDRYWLGPRQFTDAELQILAENIVRQVRRRGPFLSMAEFVNRQLGSGETSLKGALQQAIDESNLNQQLAQSTNAGFEIPLDSVADYKYANPEAGAGPSYQGAPGFITQADLLSILGNAATARSDSFTIRGYGEARDKSGKVIATAWCEAQVQRLPEWVDEVDAAEAEPADLSPANQLFGRRFHVLSFRWLSPGEV